MSFKCAKCKQTSKPKEKMYKVAISKRQKTYRFKRGKGEGTSQGWETVAEAPYCVRCYDIYLKAQKEQKKEANVLELQKQYK